MGNVAPLAAALEVASDGDPLKTQLGCGRHGSIRGGDLGSNDGHAGQSPGRHDRSGDAADERDHPRAMVSEDTWESVRALADQLGDGETQRLGGQPAQLIWNRFSTIAMSAIMDVAMSRIRR